MGDTHVPATAASAWRDWPPGTRVVVRRRLHPGEAGGKRWTDVIGIVLAAGDDGIRLRTDAPRRPAEEVWVAAAEIEVAKRIPPRARPR